MKYFGIILLLLFASCKPDKSTAVEISAVGDQLKKVSSDELVVVDYKGLKPYLKKKDGKTYVVNFWATWCAPCVKELPYFESLNENYKGEGVEVLLVSLDFPRKYETKLKPFIKERGLQSQVIAFDDLDQNTWIPAINEDWSGAIPATIIYNKNKSKFYERSFNYEELETEVKKFIK